MLVDSHCHLDYFADELKEVIDRAAAAGVGRMVTIATRPRQVATHRAFADAHEAVFFAAGLHPLHAHEEPHPSVADILGWAEHPKMVGVGEAGLDYHYQRETAATQAATFETQIEAARRAGLPLIIHSRDADDDMAAILQREHAAEPFTCVMHCFSSGRALAETALSLGFYLSMSGVATFKKADDLRAIFRDAPIDRILVETDAPYLAPPPHRGKRCEPAYVALTAAVGAELFEMPLDDFAVATTRNFHRLFNRAPALSEAA